MKFLVTGVAGYIGSVLIGKLLKKQHKVIGVDTLRYANGSSLQGYWHDKNFEFHKTDVRGIEVIRLAKQADVVIPLAALVGAPICEKWPLEAKQVNYLAVKTLVESLSPNQEVFYPNSNSGYGETDGTSEVSEDDRLSPISVYGVTKCEGEKAVLNHPKGTSFRLATVFGSSLRPRLDLMVNDFTKKLAQTGRLEIYEPHFLRNFVGVQDVCNAFLWGIFNYCLQSHRPFHMIEEYRYRKWPHGVYNLGLPTANLNKLQLAHKVCEVLGISKEGVTIGNGTDPDRRNYKVSNAKILSTGFSFAHSLEDGIKEVENIVRYSRSEDLARMRNV